MGCLYNGTALQYISSRDYLAPAVKLLRLVRIVILSVYVLPGNTRIIDDVYAVIDL